MSEVKLKNMWKFLIETNYDATDIGSDMRCTICTRILINAHDSVCGCRYCLECVKAYLNGERRFCPGNTDDCKVEELDIDRNIYPDYAINHGISKLIVTCRYSCRYRCELKNIEEYEKTCQRQLIDYPYINVGCRETRLVTDRINEHLVRENESHARLLMTCIDRLDSEIASMKIETVELRSEMAQIRLAREIDEARARETNEVMDQIKQEVANLRNENKLAKEENNSLKAEIENYRSEYLGLVAVTEQQLEEMRTREQTQARDMELLTEKYSRSEEKFGELEWQTRNDKAELGRNILRMQENWVEFVWPIDGWAAKSRSARNGRCKEIFSDPFYSHKNGYKMCLYVWPDGYGASKGTNLTVFFTLMRGPFDNILPWPFKHDVTLSIINQHTGIDHVCDTITFDDFPNYVSWNKPSTRINKGFGTDELVKLTTLSSDANLCQGDKLFIKCVVK